MEPITLVRLDNLPVFNTRPEAVTECGCNDIRRIHPVCDDGTGNWYVDFVGTATNIIGYIVFPETIDVIE